MHNVDMHNLELRFIYRPARDRLPRWMYRVWCWF